LTLERDAGSASTVAAVKGGVSRCAAALGAAALVGAAGTALGPAVPAIAQPVSDQFTTPGNTSWSVPPGTELGILVAGAGANGTSGVRAPTAPAGTTAAAMVGSAAVGAGARLPPVGLPAAGRRRPRGDLWTGRLVFP
jgi:hypothetical protein